MSKTIIKGIPENMMYIDGNVWIANILCKINFLIFYNVKIISVFYGNAGK